MKVQIKEYILSLGADVCGFADIGRFSSAPPGFNPRDIFPDCESVIVFGIALPRGLTKVNPRLIYGYYNTGNCSTVDLIAFSAAKELERLCGGFAVPLPSDTPYEYWTPENMNGRGLISMRHAGMLAGLGTLGKNTLLLNKEYGSMLTLGAVLTELKLEPDPLAKSICIEGCNMCIKSCPPNALDGEYANQAKCRPYTYGKNARGFDTVNCNICRTVCPMKYGVADRLKLSLT